MLLWWSEFGRHFPDLLGRVSSHASENFSLTVFSFLFPVTALQRTCFAPVSWINCETPEYEIEWNNLSYLICKCEFGNKIYFNVNILFFHSCCLAVQNGLHVSGADAYAWLNQQFRRKFNWLVINIINSSLDLPVSCVQYCLSICTIWVNFESFIN
jgi:hypothetical protein